MRDHANALLGKYAEAATAFGGTPVLLVPDGEDPAKDLVQALGKAMDRMNGLISIAETKFAQTNLGVDTAIEFDNDDDDGWRSFLRFGRDGKEWRLFIATDFQGKSDDTIKDWELLANAPRRTRANALEALPNLYAQMLAMAKFEADVINNCVKNAEAFLATVGRK